MNSEKPIAEKSGLDWLYSLKTDLNGIVNFYCLPPGKYLIKTTFSKKNLEMQFEPELNVVEITSMATEVCFVYIQNWPIK